MVSPARAAVLLTALRGPCGADGEARLKVGAFFKYLFYFIWPRSQGEGIKNGGLLPLSPPASSVLLSPPHSTSKLDLPASFVPDPGLAPVHVLTCVGGLRPLLGKYRGAPPFVASPGIRNPGEKRPVGGSKPRRALLPLVGRWILSSGSWDTRPNPPSFLIALSGETRVCKWRTIRFNLQLS